MERNFLLSSYQGSCQLFIGKAQKATVMIDVAVPNESIRKKGDEKLEKDQGWKEELQSLWNVKVKVIPSGGRTQSSGS